MGRKVWAVRRVGEQLPLEGVDVLLYLRQVERGHCHTKKNTFFSGLGWDAARFSLDTSDSI